MARTLSIWFTSDVHDRRGFGAKLASLVGPDELLVDCGDALRGSSTVYHAREGVVEEFARAPYRAQAVGNREFHYLHRFFAARAKALPMPLVCTNIEDLQHREPAPFVHELHLSVGGVLVRLLALLVPQYRTRSGWERLFGWRFLAPEVALSRAFSAGQPEAEPDVTLLLSHLGLKADRIIAARFGRLSAILGGHSHDTLTEPEIVAGVPIVHAGAFARDAGNLVLSLGGERPSVVSYRLHALRDEKS
jgi:5'-nucleotidase